jgi:hypothetical protein
MFISGSQLQTINSQALQSALSQIGEWMGKAVHWIQIKSTSLAFPEIHLQSKWGAVLTIAAADLLIYQLAYRIANLLDPEHNYIEARPGHFSMQLGALFAIGYGLGVLALTKIVKVPLNTSTLVGVHVIAFLGSLILSSYFQAR